MASSQELRIAASQARRTYIGTTFCPQEAQMCATYADMPPGTQLDFIGARQAVQAGGDPGDISAGFLETVRNSGITAVAVKNCLARIAAGDCTIYPTTAP